MPYRINEFSDIMGVSAFNIRYYEKKGYPGAERNASGYRQYDLKDIYQLSFFLDMQSQGFSVAESIDRLEPHSTKEYCKALEENNAKFEEQIWLLQQKKKWNDYLQYCFANVEKELTAVHEIQVPDQCFLKIAEDEDFKMSVGNGEQIGVWTELLPITHFGGIFNKMGKEQMREDLGMFISEEAASKYHLQCENVRHIPGGKFIAMMTDHYDVDRILQDPRVKALDKADLEEVYYVPLKVATQEYGRDMNYLLFRTKEK